MTEEDFEVGAERVAFRVIKANVDCMFDRKRKPEDHLKAALWVFGDMRSDYDIENCCLVLGTRCDVLRLRIQYEFWRHWYVPIQFPFSIDLVPDTVEGEINMVGGREGKALARTAWSQPGIRSAELLTQVSQETGKEIEHLRNTLKALSDRYLMSQKNDSWYLTGRNPILRAMDIEAATCRAPRNNLSWSRMF